MTLRGYTLVEILVAIALFALGVAALLPLAVANLRAVDAAGVRT
ncbi:MAG: type II secretion system protein, partial [Candidatus Dadabacteria bacterium]